MMNGGPGQFGSHGAAMGPGRGDASAMMGGPGGMSGMHDVAGMMQMMMQMHGAGGGPGMELMGPADASTDRFDADGDGTVTAEEAHDGMQGLLTEHDADGDGALNLDEYAALYAAMTRETMVDGFQELDADGDGKVTASEITEPADRMVRMRPFAMPRAPGGAARMPGAGVMGAQEDGPMMGAH